jgi:hypothetical protein
MPEKTLLDEINEENFRNAVSELAKKENISVEAAYLLLKTENDPTAQKVIRGQAQQLSNLQKKRSESDTDIIAKMKKRYYEGIHSGNSMRIHNAMGIKADLQRVYGIQVSPHDKQED